MTSESRRLIGIGAVLTLGFCVALAPTQSDKRTGPQQPLLAEPQYAQPEQPAQPIQDTGYEPRPRVAGLAGTRLFPLSEDTAGTSPDVEGQAREGDVVNIGDRSIDVDADIYSPGNPDGRVVKIGADIDVDEVPAPDSRQGLVSFGEPMEVSDVIAGTQSARRDFGSDIDVAAIPRDEATTLRALGDPRRDP